MVDEAFEQGEEIAVVDGTLVGESRSRDGQRPGP
jgi:hypothetical protein